MVKTSLSSARCAGSIPEQGAKTSHVLWPKIIIMITIKQKQYCNKLKKDFTNGSHQKKNLKKKKKAGENGVEGMVEVGILKGLVTIGFHEVIFEQPVGSEGMSQAVILWKSDSGTAACAKALRWELQA